MGEAESPSGRLVTLRAGLYAALAGRDLVLLDVLSGHYDLCAGLGDSLQVGPTGRTLRLTSSAGLETLQASGVLDDQDQPDLGAPLPPRPTRSLIELAVKPTLRERLIFAGAWSDLSSHYYGRGLPHLLAFAGAARTRDRRTRLGLPVLERRARVFHQLSPWAPFPGDCVFRCLMLFRHLHQVGAENVCWVFGVRTWPFYAHCWLQQGDTALTDHPEPLASFTPIFAL